MVYTTCCIDSTARLINDMVDGAREITWKTFRKYAEGIDEWCIDMGYGPWLHIKNDYAVSFYKSKYNGKPCVYVNHSAIEYIWT